MGHAEEIEQANRACIATFTPVRVAPGPRPRVLVTGFGRFPRVRDNASGRIVSALVPSVVYPDRDANDSFEPAKELAMGAGTITLASAERSIEVDVVGMVLPVSWHLAPALALAQIGAMDPTIVLMMGVAGERQPLWLELGAQNRTKDAVDVAGIAPISTRLVEDASDTESLFFPWKPTCDAAAAAIAERAHVIESGARFDAIVHGAIFAPFPRASNAYLCNALAFAVAHAMTTAKRTAPRAFVHIPSALAGTHIEAAADVMRAILGAGIEGEAAWGDRVNGDAVDAGAFY